MLRGSYRTKKNEYEPSGSGAKKKKIWAYFESLTFLNPYISERKTCSNIDKAFEEKSQDTLQDNSESNSESNDQLSINTADYELDDGGFLVENVETSADNDASTPSTSHSAKDKKKRRIGFY
jgi:hypothetical protein